MSTYAEFLAESGYKDIRFIDNGKRWIAISNYIFTCAILRGTTGNIHSFDDRWCYEDYEMAKKALDDWDGIGEPPGWHRHVLTGRRRPGGDPAKEYVNF